MDQHELITLDPNVWHGKACFKGTRIMVFAVLDKLAAGPKVETVLENYPYP